MGFVIEPIPDPEDVAALKPLLDHKDDAEFVAQLLESLNKANDQARDGGLDRALYDALPLEGIDGWPTTLDIIVLTQKGTDPQWNPAFVEGTSFYSRYGTLFGQVTPFV